MSESKKVERGVGIGSLYQLKGGNDFYILACSGYADAANRQVKVGIISLRDGNRWFESAVVNNSRCLTEEERIKAVPLSDFKYIGFVKNITKTKGKKELVIKFC